MNPVAFEVFGQPIRWYGIIIAGGVLVAFLVSYLLSKKKKLDFDLIIDGFLWSFPFAIIGARLYYVAFEYKNYHSFMDVINIRNGGMAIHGGLIGGLVVAYIFTRVRKVNFFEFDNLLIFTVFFLFLRLLEFKLPIVHYFTYGRNGVGRNFNEIQILFLRKSQCSGSAHNAELFTCGRDYSHFLIANFFVDLMLIFNGRIPRKNNRVAYT